MKEKIFKAIDKGLMNVLSTDIQDHDIDFDHDNINSEYIPYEYRTVDMGKAGIWCEYNLGAFPGNRPEDWYGDYYAWGEIETKDDYSWETYQYCNEIKDTITKYCKIDRLKQLKSIDDAITQTLSHKFRIPTKEEYEKLINNSTNEQVENYKDIKGLNGRLFTAENGNTLFFPASGYYDVSERYFTGQLGSVWSASIDSVDPDSAFSFHFYSDEVCVNGGGRYCGLPVRGIRNQL